MPETHLLPRHIEAFATSALAPWHSLEPWGLVTQAATIVRTLAAGLAAQHYAIEGDVAVHRSATVEPGAVLKGPLVIGAGCFVAAGAYLRGGNWLAERCTVGPGVELKSCFVFAGSTLAHFNFVGDSIVGSNVNLEAGSIVCNHRNERADKQIRVRLGGSLQVLHDTGCDKFGALIGDGVRIGANAVLAPGTLLEPGRVVARASHIDQEIAP